MKRLSITLLFFCFCIISQAQNYFINQNQQAVNINLPVIEKKVYIDRYRTVYVERPRVARKLSAPIQLLGYLWVYPADLGNFNSVPLSVIANLNSQSPYGRNSWRIPTPDELCVLEANAEEIGLGDDIYLATDHRNGVLRLVSTGSSVEENDAAERRGEIVIYAGTKWATMNVGASNPAQEGREFDWHECNAYVPPMGWRLPTISEMTTFSNINTETRDMQNLGNVDAYATWWHNKYGENLIYKIVNNAYSDPSDRGMIYIIGGTKSLVFPYRSDTGRYWCVDDSSGKLQVMEIDFRYGIEIGRRGYEGYDDDYTIYGNIRLVKE